VVGALKPGSIVMFARGSVTDTILEYVPVAGSYRASVIGAMPGCSGSISFVQICRWTRL
jgi:hypothetical protein